MKWNKNFTTSTYMKKSVESRINKGNKTLD